MPRMPTRQQAQISIRRRAPSAGPMPVSGSPPRWGRPERPPSGCARAISWSSSARKRSRWSSRSLRCSIAAGDGLDRSVSEVAFELESKPAADDLRRKADDGDAQAATALALRLLVGRDAPFAPEEGVGLIERAAAEGEPEALCTLATLRG